MIVTLITNEEPYIFENVSYVSIDRDGTLFDVEHAEDFILEDAETIKRGRWIEVSDGLGYVGEPCEACSVCGMQTDYPSNYCPSCGARMDEVE